MSFEPQKRILMVNNGKRILRAVECPQCGYGYAVLSEYCEDGIKQRNSINCTMCGFSDYWDTEKRKEQK